MNSDYLISIENVQSIGFIYLLFLNVLGCAWQTYIHTSDTNFDFK